MEEECCTLWVHPGILTLQGHLQDPSLDRCEGMVAVPEVAEVEEVEAEAVVVVVADAEVAEAELAEAEAEVDVVEAGFN